ncbi:winged helix-turn-helix domain-containing protein [Legionella gresilensis]
MLRQTLDELFLPCRVWNSKTITDLIKKRFGVRYLGSGLRDLLK